MGRWDLIGSLGACHNTDHSGTLVIASECSSEGQGLIPVSHLILFGPDCLLARAGHSTGPLGKVSQDYTAELHLLHG